MKLLVRKTIEILPSSPFNFDLTFFKPDHFTTDDHIYEKGLRWQTMNYKGEKLGLKFQNKGTVEKPKLFISIFSNKKLREEYIHSLRQEIIYRYNLSLSLKDFYHFGSRDPLLSKTTSSMRGMRPGQPSSLYEYLIIGIILQNASIKRSVQMFKNLLKKYGRVLEFDNKKLLCLWDIGRFKDVKEQELRDLKIGYRAKYIIKTDEQFRTGNIEELSLRKENIVNQKGKLLSLYGVGPATVWYLLFDVFHRWDVFEHISPWEQKLYSRMFFNKEIVSVKVLLKYIGRFKEYKHLAIHYFWEKLWWDRFRGITFDWLEKEIRN